MAPFSLSQIVGYVAFVLGTAAFLQRSDRRLMALNATQSLVYAAHFVLLGNPAAAGSALISSVRSFLALRYRSLVLAAGIIVANLGVGMVVGKTAASWLPIIASTCATVAIFTLKGVPLRCVLLGCTLLWLANNILSGSIGGTLLESVIATANTSTIFRMVRSVKNAGTPSQISGELT